MKGSDQIKQIIGTVENNSKFNTGYSAAVSRQGVHFIITAPNRADLKFLSCIIMDENFKLDDKEVKETAMCLASKVIVKE